PQTFLWWANPAVSVNENYQSVFPQDVHFVADHGKRDISRFPIATGTYYEIDYSEGVDISWYKNIPVPSSYMVLSSKYDFVGGYDHGKEAGILHVADHHISPGKKQWTWGNGDFGKAWERNLTDNDGPYVELMTGVYTDNQPDFSWLQPYETKNFTQYFLPYQNIGVVKNASKDLALNMDLEENELSVGVYATKKFGDLKVIVKDNESVIWQDQIEVSPGHAFQKKIKLNKDLSENELRFAIFDNNDNELLRYQAEKQEETAFPEPAKEAKPPKEITSTDQLYLTGRHLEQYRHATYSPDPYYLEALKRDPDDADNNNAYGLLLMRKGAVAASIPYFKKAIKTLTQRNPNPYKSEPFYNLGLALFYLGKYDEAYDNFYKCIWKEEWKAAGYLHLARIDCIKRDFKKALTHIEQSLEGNSKNNVALNLKVSALRKAGEYKDALRVCKKSIKLDPLNYGALYEIVQIQNALNDKEEKENAQKALLTYLDRDVNNYLELSTEYLDMGMYDDAIEILNLATEGSNSSFIQNYPMLYYYLAYAFSQNGQEEKAEKYLKTAEEQPSDYCFPNSLHSMKILEFAIRFHPEGAKAFYYLGNLLFDKSQYDEAIIKWEKSREHDNSFPTVHRNLAIAYYNKKSKVNEAINALEKAFSLNPNDARVFFELDQLYQKENVDLEVRLNYLNKYDELVQERDDLYLEKITLLNYLGKYDEALELFSSRNFHPWEGGEGKVTGQYVLSHVQRGKQYLEERKYQKAIEEFQKARTYPENLGEGKLTGARENNIHYYLGLTFEQMGKEDEAVSHFKKAAKGNYQPSLSMYYYDKASDMIFYQGLAEYQLGNKSKAKSHFHKLIDYGEAHLFDDVMIDYFAISLPDFLVFDEDLEKKNKVNCHYLIALGFTGLKNHEEARKHFEWILKNDINQTNAKNYLEDLKQIVRVNRK
ncbi:MAG TPA: DUF5107 domain-containing protein, partial [Balneolales bacterium]|nr:DUF5107 domain-containing protein [Balneolales bacterium]